MQDIHTIGVGGGGGGGGRLFGGGERRLRQHHHQGHGGGQSLKCPRCDSVNTKFCYYNNYNLSQPRHFCKSCRRYWTKGGVLRNVPVGGGCRKTKRNPKSDRRKSSENSQSSSDSSSLTASTATPEIASAVVPNTVEKSSSPEQILVPTQAPRLLDFSNTIANPTQDPMMSSPYPSDSGGIRSFTSMMTSPADPLMEFDFGYRVHLQSDQWPTQQQEATNSMPEELKMQEITGGFLDQTAHIDLTGGRHHGGIGTLDHELFDLSGTVDQAYWTQPQWTDNDHSLYLP